MQSGSKRTGRIRIVPDRTTTIHMRGTQGRTYAAYDRNTELPGMDDLVMTTAVVVRTCFARTVGLSVRSQESRANGLLTSHEDYHQVAIEILSRIKCGNRGICGQRQLERTEAGGRGNWPLVFSERLAGCLRGMVLIEHQALGSGPPRTIVRLRRGRIYSL